MRRWFRLMPLFLTLLVVAILARGLYEIAFIDNPFAVSREMRLERLNAESHHWFVHILLHLSLLHGIVPDSILPYSGTTFLAPAWSLSLEWQFYVVAPLLMGAMTSWRKSWLIVLAIAVSMIALRGQVATWLYQPFLPLALPFFFGGITSRLLLEKRIPWLALAATIVATLAYLWGHGGRHAIWALLPVALIWATFLFITAREAAIISVRSRLLDGISWLIALNPAIVALGKVSYSTYLCHIPIFSIVVGTAMAVSGRSDQPFIVAATIAAIIASGGMSFLLFKFVERPGVQIGNRWARSAATKTPPLA